MPEDEKLTFIESQNLKSTTKKENCLTKLSTEKPLLFSFISCFWVGLFGDLLCQLIELALNQIKNISWNRTICTTFSSTILAPVLFYWYTFLESKLPGNEIKTVAVKAFYDYLFAAPYFVLFYLSLAVYSTIIKLVFMFTAVPKPSLKCIYNTFILTCKSKIPVLMIIDFFLWIPCQIINFKLISSKFRVFGTKMMEVLFMVLLSFISFNDIDYWGKAEGFLYGGNETMSGGGDQQQNQNVSGCEGEFILGY